MAEKLTKQQRAAAIREANRLRIERLKAAKEERKAGKAKADPEAKAAAAKAKAAEKAAAAKEKEKAQKAARAAAARELDPIAKEINVRFEKASKLERDADDHRLAAALRLKDAEEKCKAAGLVFRAWSEEHVKGQSFETIRKLLAVGKAEDPVKALADLRGRNAERNKELRERQRAEREATQPRQMIGHNQGPALTEPAPISSGVLIGVQPAADGEEAKLVVKAVGEPEKATAETEALKRYVEAYLTEGDLAAAKLAFEGLGASAKVSFVEWAGLKIGATVTMPDFGAPDANQPELPRAAEVISEALSGALSGAAVSLEAMTEVPVTEPEPDGVTIVDPEPVADGVPSAEPLPGTAMEKAEEAAKAAGEPVKKERKLRRKA